MVSDFEKQALVKMFCAYCRRALRNERTDIARKGARRARWETFFSDMDEAELSRLVVPERFCGETVFEVGDREIVVLGEEVADAMRELPEEERAAVLLYYFAGWPDRRIAVEMGCSRSTVQLRRTKALAALKAILESEVDVHAGL